jgi:hypothetical protein
VTDDYTDRHLNMQQKVEIFLRGLQAETDLFMVRHYPTLSVDRFTCDFSKQAKYWRIVREGDVQRFVECFVDKATGDVYKAKGWKAPNLDPRGNVSTMKGLREILARKVERHYDYLYKR